MLNIVKVILFLLVNLGGFYTIAILVNVSVQLGIFPSMPTTAMHNDFLNWLGLGTMVWLAAAIVSLGYFFIEDKLRVLLILAPLYVPFIYGICVMIYFNYMASVV